MSSKYKHKYTQVKEIYNNVKNNLQKKINYSTFYKIVKRYFEILIRDLVIREEKIHLPNNMGYVYLDKREHRRAFHVRVDQKATKETGELVKYKVPILDDFYHKLVWVRPKKYKNCKIMPLGIYKRVINNIK